FKERLRRHATSRRVGSGAPTDLILNRAFSFGFRQFTCRTMSPRSFRANTYTSARIVTVCSLAPGRFPSLRDHVVRRVMERGPESTAYQPDAAKPAIASHLDVGRHVAGLRRPGVQQPDHPMKSAMFLIAGVCWVLFALSFGIVLLKYIGQGAGLQFFGWMFSSGSVLIGLVHAVGFGIAAFLCFAVGAVLLARGFVRAG